MIKHAHKNIIFTHKPMHDHNHPETKPQHEEHAHEGHHHPPGGPGPKPEGVPPHILKELLELREKIGRLEGMMEVLLKKQ